MDIRRIDSCIFRNNGNETVSSRYVRLGLFSLRLYAKMKSEIYKNYIRRARARAHVEQHLFEDIETHVEEGARSSSYGTAYNRTYVSGRLCSKTSSGSRTPLASKYSTKRVKSQDWPEVLGGLDARDSAIHGTSYPRGRLERARREEGRARKEG